MTEQRRVSFSERFVLFIIRAASFEPANYSFNRSVISHFIVTLIRVEVANVGR